MKAVVSVGNGDSGIGGDDIQGKGPVALMYKSEMDFTHIIFKSFKGNNNY